jgi:HYR domain
MTIVLNAAIVKSSLHTLACQLSRRPILHFPCPDFICPLTRVQFGYPWAQLYEVWWDTQARNGFAPVSISQSPPPGSILRFGTTTEVTVTATDAANQSLSCTSTVIAPPLVVCGDVEMNVTAGSYSRVGAFRPRGDIVTGTVFKLKGILQSRLTGKGSVIARLRKGGNKLTGSIVFQGNRTKGALNNLMITAPFTYFNASKSLVVDVQVNNNTNQGDNVARYVVYCQELFTT